MTELQATRSGGKIEHATQIGHVFGREPRLVVFGAGAIGRSVAGWLAEAGLHATLIARPKTAEAIARDGLAMRDMSRAHARSIRVPVASHVTKEVTDVLFLCVKTYDLESVGAELAELAQPAEKIPLVVALQNGVANQEILPRYFPKLAYAVVGYNAWLDETGALAYRRRGPLLIGTPDGSLAQECRALSAHIAPAIPTHYTDRFDDAAHTKLIINLANAFQALIGHPLKPISDRSLAQRIVSSLLWEGVVIARAAGYREHRIAGLPPWWLIHLSAKLPPLLTRPAFNRALSKLAISSMAQDMLVRGGRSNELEALNGHFVRLAERFHIESPVNRGIYRLCCERFGPGFEPMDVREVARALF